MIDIFSIERSTASSRWKMRVSLNTLADTATTQPGRESIQSIQMDRSKLRRKRGGAHPKRLDSSRKGFESGMKRASYGQIALKLAGCVQWYNFRPYAPRTLLTEN